MSFNFTCTEIGIKLDDSAFLPCFAHALDAGVDLRTPISFEIEPNSEVIIDTGVHFSIPSGYVGMITSKSGLMAKGITVRGTIDSGYTGSVKAVLFNHSDETIRFFRGDKICQIIFLSLPTVKFVVNDVSCRSMRGDGGFGSSGK